jgi:hypothetical protein
MLQHQAISGASAFSIGQAPYKVLTPKTESGGGIEYVWGLQVLAIALHFNLILLLFHNSTPKQFEVAMLFLCNPVSFCLLEMTGVYFSPYLDLDMLSSRNHPLNLIFLLPSGYAMAMP